MGLILPCYLGLYGILSGLTKSTDHPSESWEFEAGERGLKAEELGNWELLLGGAGELGSWRVGGWELGSW